MVSFTGVPPSKIKLTGTFVAAVLPKFLTSTVINSAAVRAVELIGSITAVTPTSLQMVRKPSRYLKSNTSCNFLAI